jgi:hypothetical protein
VFRPRDRRETLQFTHPKNCFTSHCGHLTGKGIICGISKMQLRSVSSLVDRASRELSPGKRYIAKMENVECWKVVDHPETPIEMPL